MPVRFPISSGNWSNPAIWDNGVGPVAGDFVNANGFTVTIDQNVNVGYISNGASGVYVPNIASPAMTGFSTPSGTASASTTNGTQFAWYAFDQTGTNWQATATTAWLQYQFPTAKIIKRYALLGYPSQSNNPRNWTFEGSNDGSTWTVLQTVTLGAAIAASAWYDSGVLANTTAYLYYRINVTLGGGGFIGLAEFQMTESTSTSIGNNPNGTFAMPTAYNITCTTSTGIINSGTTNVNPTLTISATTGSIAINSNIRGGTITSSNALTISGAGHNITITGDVFGGSGTATFGINRNASGTLNINGVIYSGLTTSTAYSLNNTALGTGTITVIGGISTSGSAVAPGIINAAVCTINITGNIGGTLTNQNTSLFNNSGAATINITGTVSVATTGFNAVYGLGNSGNSTITINGNVNGGTASGTNNNGVNSSLGSVTITGNITGGGASSQFGAVSSGGTLTVNGTVTGGTNCSGISSSGTSVTINGDVYASATSPGAESSSNTTLFLLNGSAYGNGYLTAFAVRRLGIIPNPSMVYRMANNTGAAYNFYPVGSTALGTPATTDVRNGVVYASGALTGTLVVPPATAVTVGVTYDNGTLGTAQNTAASFLTALGTSTDPLAVRLQNVSTVQTTGAQIAAYNV